MGYLKVAGAAVLWGMWALFLRPSGLSGPAGALVALGVIALPSFFLVRGAPWKDRRALVAVALLGVFDALNAGLYFGALDKGPVPVAALTHYLGPLLAAVFAPLVLKERRSMRALLCAPVMLFGLALVVGLRPSSGALDTALWGGGSALFFAGSILAAKVAGRSYGPLEVTSLHAVVSVPFILLIFRGDAVPAASWELGYMVAGALLCGIGGSVLFNAGLKQVPAQGASALTYLEPVVATSLGFFVWREALGWPSLVGIALVLGGGVFVALEPPAPAPSR